MGSGKDEKGKYLTPDVKFSRRHRCIYQFYPSNLSFSTGNTLISARTVFSRKHIFRCLHYTILPKTWKETAEPAKPVAPSIFHSHTADCCCPTVFFTCFLAVSAWILMLSYMDLESDSIMICVHHPQYANPEISRSPTAWPCVANSLFSTAVIAALRNIA